MQPYEKEAVLFLVRHLVSGMAGAAVLATGILLLDIGNLGTLVLNSEHGFVAVFLLYAGLMITFGSVAMSIGIIGLGEDASEDYGP